MTLGISLKTGRKASLWQDFIVSFAVTANNICFYQQCTKMYMYMYVSCVYPVMSKKKKNNCKLYSKEQKEVSFPSFSIKSSLSCTHYAITVSFNSLSLYIYIYTCNLPLHEHPP